MDPEPQETAAHPRPHVAGTVGESTAPDAGLEPECTALAETAGLLDLSGRGRLCLTGADRQSFLNGQVTNNVRDLRVGQGCYAMLVNARGRVQADVNIHLLPDEILLDFEPGITHAICKRLEHYIIAEDVQVVDAAPFYGLLSVQGPRALDAVKAWGWGADLPSVRGDIRCWRREGWGDLYLARQPRFGTCGFDLFLPVESAAQAGRELAGAVRSVGGQPCGSQATEIVRVVSGIPRFGVDIDDTNLAPEVGGDLDAISYTKGCYIGQEVIARIRTYGQVTKLLKRLRLAKELPSLPKRGEKLLKDGREAGYVTSAVHCPRHQVNMALGYVRREVATPGLELQLSSEWGGTAVVC